MTVTPDTKDWTWVLDERCDECGLDTRRLASGDVPALVRAVAAAFAGALADTGAARRRPAPQVWSALEYACHVRDVCRRFDARLRLMLVLDGPVFTNWDQDAAALADAYAEQDPARVALELAEAAAVLADTVEAVPPDAWARPGLRSDGAAFTVATLARYLAHDLAHHAYDVTGRPLLP